MEGTTPFRGICRATSTTGEDMSNADTDGQSEQSCSDILMKITIITTKGYVHTYSMPNRGDRIIVDDSADANDLGLVASIIVEIANKYRLYSFTAAAAIEPVALHAAVRSSLGVGQCEWRTLRDGRECLFCLIQCPDGSLKEVCRGCKYGKHCPDGTTC